MPQPPTLPPAAKEPLSVILLASDAAAHVGAVLTGWLDWLEKRGKAYELILVDDGSADGTADLADKAAEGNLRLRVLRHPHRQGEGAALRTGLAASEKPLVCYALCHPDYRPADLERMLDKPMPDPTQGKEIDHVHLMSAYRAGVPVPGALRALGWVWRVICIVVFSYRPAPLPGWLGMRRYLGWFLTRVVFALRHHDVTCPFRLFRRGILARIPIQSNTAFAHVELLAKANFLGHMMAEEVPIAVRPGPYRGDFGKMWREGRRVFDHPDFGPPVLPAAGAAS
jgi:glycosyltransferase involved in cell wall biosynthesis